MRQLKVYRREKIEIIVPHLNFPMAEKNAILRKVTTDALIATMAD